ncbi:MAG: hypothetical protein HUU37_04610 [Bdellovibrionales bacterium]|nr:hypothetical protein [Bdellovibrionales bacterium]
MEDYPKFVDLNPSVARLTCVVLGTGEVHNPGVLQEIRIGRYDQIIPGTPSNGPLFPGAPDQVITKLSVPIIVTPNSADATNRQVEELMMRQFPSAKTALHSSGDLMTTAEYSNGALLQIAYRKNGAE